YHILRTDKSGEKVMSRWKLAIVCCYMAILLGQRLAAQSNRESDFAGQWWNSAVTEEKLGFLSGHEDCFVWESKRLRSRFLSEKDLMVQIDEYFTEPANLRKP